MVAKKTTKKAKVVKPDEAGKSAPVIDDMGAEVAMPKDSKNKASATPKKAKAATKDSVAKPPAKKTKKRSVNEVEASEEKPKKKKAKVLKSEEVEGIHFLTFNSHVFLTIKHKCIPCRGCRGGP